MITRSPIAAAMLLASAGCMVAPAAGIVAGAACESASHYNGWKIRSIQIKSPFDFFPAASAGLAQIATTLPLQQKDPFDAQKFDAGVAYITNAVKSLLPFEFATVRLVVTTNALQNCTEAVDVRYTVYTAIVPSLSGKSYELHQSEVERPATTGGSIAASGNFVAIPNFGYDAARHGFGGGTLQSIVPMTLFDTFKLDTSASSNSLLGDLALSGRRTPGETYLNHVQWQLISSYKDLPVGNERLKEGMLAADFFGSTKGLGSHGIVLNYGASVAGGHQQNSTAGALNSSYGDLKFLADLENKWGANAFAAAYGLQLGSTLSGRTVDFAKHIVDVRYSMVHTSMPGFLKHTDTCKPETACDDRSKFVGADHRPLSAEFRATGGVIQTFGVTPAAERFFGGNQQLSPFIDGQPWDVRGQPYIRSIPEYRLGSSGPASFGFGGTRFYSVNVTVAKAVAGRAILPKELGETDFVQKLDGAMKTAAGYISDGYFGKDPRVKLAGTEVTALGNEVALLKLPDPASFDAATQKLLAPQISSINLSLKLIAGTVTAITVKKTSPNPNALINSLLPGLDTKLTGLRNLLVSASRADLAAAIEQRQTAIDAAKQKVIQAWNPSDSSGAPSPIQQARTLADQKAAADMKPANSILNTVLYQLNAYSVAPVGIFDIARVWPSGVGVRYGVGGGVRLSLVNANFTIGYAVNPHRLPGEGVGALFFKLDVTDLFH